MLATEATDVKSRGGFRYSLVSLIEALLIGRLIRSASNLPEVLVRCISFVLGSEVAEQVKLAIAEKQLKIPSATALTRARQKFDVFLMLWRRKSFRTTDPYFVMLSTDASPQGGSDYLMTLEDRVTRKAAGLLIDSDPDDLAAWNIAGHLSKSTLPVSLVGSGNSGLAAKFEGVFHSVKLDIGTQDP